MDLPQRLRRQAELLEHLAAWGARIHDKDPLRGSPATDRDLIREAFEAGATQQQIATAYGVSQQYISKLLKKEEK